MSINCPAHSVVLLCYMVLKPLYIHIILICGTSYLSYAYPFYDIRSWPLWDDISMPCLSIGLSYIRQRLYQAPLITTNWLDDIGTYWFGSYWQLSASLNSSDCFLLQTNAKFYAWSGNLSSAENQKVALRVAEFLKVGHSGIMLP